MPVFIGCGAIFWFSLDTSPSFPVLAITCLIAAGLASFTKYRSGLAATACGFFALFLLGMLFAEVETRRVGTVVLDTPVTTTITGTVTRREVDARGDWRYVVRLAATEAPALSRPPEKVSLLSRGEVNLSHWARPFVARRGFRHHPARLCRGSTISLSPPISGA